MRKKSLLISLFFILNISLFAADIFGTWVCFKYDRDVSNNLLDIVSIVEVDSSNAIVQHSFYLQKEKDYIIAAKIVDNKIHYHDPITGWDVVLEVSSNGTILTWFPDFDDQFVKQFRRPDSDFYNFLDDIDSFLADSSNLAK